MVRKQSIILVVSCCVNRGEMVSLIAALAKGGVIGQNGRVPWRLPADLHYFKQMTMGKPMIMGRKTYQSIGWPLPGRDNIILTRDPIFQATGCQVVHTIAEALAAAGSGREIMVIGGGEIYAAFFPLAKRLYLTLVEATVEGDTFFPPYPAGEWQTVSDLPHPADEKQPYPFRFVTLERLIR